MKRVLGAAALALAATATFSTAADAQMVPPPPTLLITVDENGHGTLSLDGTTAVPLISLVGAGDNGPGGLGNSLSYTVPFPFAVPGDVLLQENPNALSDVIRFNAVPGGGFLQLVFYSDNADGADDLADVGFPTAFNTNLVTLPEVGPEGDNGAFYTPTANQPGFITNFITTYHFISDSAGVPEPSTWATMLAGFGAIGLTFRRRRRKTLAPA